MPKCRVNIKSQKPKESIEYGRRNKKKRRQLAEFQRNRRQLGITNWTVTKDEKTLIIKMVRRVISFCQVFENPQVMLCDQ